MPSLSIGVANSISANFQYDPLDTIAFAKQSNFDPLQIYMNSDLLKDAKKLAKIQKKSVEFNKVYFHVEGHLNEEFINSAYKSAIYQFFEQVDNPQMIIHFDERENVDKLIRVVDALGKEPVKLCIENYFMSEGKEDAERNLRKYLALFTLSSNFGNTIYPVLDIPRIFNQKLGFSEEESLEWCYQILNFFGNRRIPLLLHLIDAKDAAMERRYYTALGSGCIPYDKIFRFMQKTHPTLSGIILEYEDKMNPLQSRDFLENYFSD